MALDLVQFEILSPDNASNLAHEILTIKRNYFPDLWFATDKTNEAFSRLICRDARAVKFKLEQGNPLHLSSIRLWMRNDENSIVPLEKLINVRIGSKFERSILNPDRLLDFSCKKICFHTDDTIPEIELEFEPGYLYMIEINNCEDEYARRAWEIEVELSVDCINWEKVYDHVAREIEFKKFCIDYLGRKFSNKIVYHVYNFIEIAFKDKESLQLVALDLIKVIGESTVNLLIDFVNAHIFKEQNLEFSLSHGLNRTFRFWTEPEKVNYVAFASNVLRALQARGNVCFLGYGALLGLVRSGDLIPQDDDLDLVVVIDRFSDDLFEIMAFLETELSAINLDVFGDFPTHRKVTDQSGSNILDVFIALRDEYGIHFNPGRCSLLPVGSIIPTQEVVFFESAVSVPANLIVYLKSMYGDSWRIPQNHFGHTWHIFN